MMKSRIVLMTVTICMFLGACSSEPELSPDAQRVQDELEAVNTTSGNMFCEWVRKDGVSKFADFASDYFEIWDTFDRDDVVTGVEAFADSCDVGESDSASFRGTAYLETLDEYYSSATGTGFQGAYCGDAATRLHGQLILTGLEIDRNVNVEADQTNWDRAEKEFYRTTC